MSLYLLASGNVIQTGPQKSVQPLSEQDRQNITVISTGGNPPPGTPVQVAEKQAFTLTVRGIGAVSASAQIVGSNDQHFPQTRNFVPLGDPISASGSGIGVASAAGTTPYAYFGAYITALTGVNAVAEVDMSA